MMDKLRLAQLLCSRMCHDLITPVGAINNGFELLGTTLNQVDEEMVYLIQKSAQNASHRLMMFRAGLSFGGQHLLSSFEKSEQLMSLFLNSHKIHFSWKNITTAMTCVDLKDQPQWGRILVNLVNIMAEAAPKGGELSISFRKQGEHISSQIALKGDLIDFKKDNSLALQGLLDEQDVTAHSIQSYLTFLLMESIPIKLTFLESTEDSILLNIESHTNTIQNSGTLF